MYDIKKIIFSFLNLLKTVFANILRRAWLRALHIKIEDTKKKKICVR